MTPIDPKNISTWHKKRQKVDGEPKITMVYEDGEEVWQCYLKEDDVSGIGSTPNKALKDWKQRTEILENYYTAG